MTSTVERPRYLTVREAAATLRLAQSTVYRLTRTGVIESVRLGGSVRIPARALEPETAKEDNA